MIRSIWNSRSGMSAQMDKMDAISNNLSNVNTVGYKKIDVSFDSLVQETLKRRGYPVEGNVRGEANLPYTGTGVKASEFQKDTSQGNLIQTSNNTDLALDGEGFFKIIDANGNEAYIRGGSFNVDSDGTIVDNNGNRLVIIGSNGENMNNPGAGFTKDNFVVDVKGNLKAEGYTDYRIPIYNTIGSNSMKSIGENLYTPAIRLDNNGNEEEVEVYETNRTDILQGYVENSNVDLGKEMADMIITQRAFQLNSTALRTADEMWQIANNLKGR